MELLGRGLGRGHRSSILTTPSPSPTVPGALCLSPCDWHLLLGLGAQLVPCPLLFPRFPPTLRSLCPSLHRSLLSALLSDQPPLFFPSTIPPHPVLFQTSVTVWANYERQTWHRTPHPSNKQENETTRKPPTTPTSRKFQVLPDLVSVPKTFFKLELLLHTRFCKQPSWLSGRQQTSLHANKYRSTARFLIAA